MKKILLLAVAAILACSFVLMSAAAPQRASLFTENDEWESDSLLPFIESGGKYLVPASAFEKILGIEVSSSDLLGSLLISDGEKYISYNLNFGRYIDEKGEVKESPIYSYGGEIYIEPYAVCEKFALVFETAFAPDGYLCARIRSEHNTDEFSALLTDYTPVKNTEKPFLYNPEGKTVAGRFVYPYVSLPTAPNISAIISLLGDNFATFVLSPHDISSYAEEIPKIYAAGHSIAYYMSNGDVEDTQTFALAMERANGFLFSLTGKTVRTYVSALGSGDMPKIDGYFAKGCKMNLVSYDFVNDKVINLVLNDQPALMIFNFSLATDATSRANYFEFFRRLGKYEDLRAMPANEATSSD